tara:strand:- start:579 stop:812 length:234 start_codon:yes stop_codon:yes gene_type:complete
MEIFHGIRFKKYLEEAKKEKKDFLEEAEKEKKELNESYKESRKQQKERKDKERSTDPLDSFSDDLQNSIKEKRKNNK